MPVERRPLRIRITLDDGLASYLRALCESEAGIFGDERETIIYAVRTFLLDMMKKDSGFKPHIVKHLPGDLRRRLDESR